MKRAAITVAVVMALAAGAALPAAAQQQGMSGKPGNVQQQQDRSRDQSMTQGQIKSDNQQPAPASNQPQAKTQEEFQAFQAAAQNPDMAAAEKATNEFAEKYPQSELKARLYQVMMHRYQAVNNAEKTVEMGHKVIALQPDNPVALVLVATVLAERTRDTDLDKDDRLGEVDKNAKAALANLDKINLGGTPTPEQAAAAKATVTSLAYGAMGTADMVNQNYTSAETNLKKSVNTPGVQADPLTLFRLSLALDHQKKYPEALQVINRAVPDAQEPVATLVRQERDRLVKLTTPTAAPAATPAAGTPPAAGAAPAPAAPAAPATQTTPPPK
jgi:tetratricopeptide (TPR) repeat protein